MQIYHITRTRKALDIDSSSQDLDVAQNPDASFSETSVKIESKRLVDMRVASIQLDELSEGRHKVRICVHPKLAADLKYHQAQGWIVLFELI